MTSLDKPTEDIGPTRTDSSLKTPNERNYYLTAVLLILVFSLFGPCGFLVHNSALDRTKIDKVVELKSHPFLLRVGGYEKQS